MYSSTGWSRNSGNLVQVLENATSADFAPLTSSMHMVWFRHVGRRLKSDCRYFHRPCYNTFLTPPKGANLSRLEPLAQAVLDVRA